MDSIQTINKEIMGLFNKKVKVYFKPVVKGLVGKPIYKHEGDAGCDVVVTRYEFLDRDGVILTTDAAVKKIRKVKYYTNLSVELPKGYELQARCRSSIHETDLRLSNGIGTIDYGYHGEITIIFDVLYVASGPIKIYQPGDRAFQLVLNKVSEADWTFKAIFSDTSRGTGGYGSTGK